MGDDYALPRFSQSGLYRFKRSFLYKLDAPKTNGTLVSNGGATPKARRLTLRDLKYQNVQNRAGKYTSLQIVDVRLPQSQNIDALREWFLKELSTKNQDDLMIFYYYGAAGEKAKKYSWKFDGPRHVWFNACDIFELCGASGLTCMFLLDCDCQDIWDDKLDPPTGHVSIFARGGELRSPDGEKLDDENGFTECFADNLSAIARDQEKTKHALRIIPMLLTPLQQRPTYKIRRCEGIFTKPVDEPTMNIVCDPKAVRAQLKKYEGAKYAPVDFFLQVTKKGDAPVTELTQPMPMIEGPAQTEGLSEKGVLAPPTTAPVQDAAPTAVMVAPPTPPASATGRARKRRAKEMSTATAGDEGYDSDNDRPGARLRATSSSPE